MATLFRVSHPDTWGENPDERRFFCISSGFLGRFPGRKLLQNAVKVFPGRHKSECFPMRNPSRRKSECFTICYTNKHKPRSASLQVSLAGTALNLWRSFLTSMMLATQIASGGRICQRRRSLELETHIFTLDPLKVHYGFSHHSAQKKEALRLPFLGCPMGFEPMTFRTTI